MRSTIPLALKIGPTAGSLLISSDILLESAGCMSSPCWLRLFFYGSKFLDAVDLEI
jgi:hypothetical protein